MITDIVSSFPERSLENGQSGSLPVMIEIYNEATGTCSRPRPLWGQGPSHVGMRSATGGYKNYVPLFYDVKTKHMMTYPRMCRTCNIWPPVVRDS